MLLFETNGTDLPIHTFLINMYGASYIAGSIASLFSYQAAVLAANAQDLSIQRSITGFSEGFIDNGGLPYPLATSPTTMKAIPCRPEHTS